MSVPRGVVTESTEENGVCATTEPISNITSNSETPNDKVARKTSLSPSSDRAPRRRRRSNDSYLDEKKPNDDNEDTPSIAVAVNEIDSKSRHRHVERRHHDKDYHRHHRSERVRSRSNNGEGLNEDPRQRRRGRRSSSRHRSTSRGYRRSTSRTRRRSSSRSRRRSTSRSRRRTLNYHSPSPTSHSRRRQHEDADEHHRSKKQRSSDDAKKRDPSQSRDESRLSPPSSPISIPMNPGEKTDEDILNPHGTSDAASGDLSNNNKRKRRTGWDAAPPPASQTPAATTPLPTTAAPTTVTPTILPSVANASMTPTTTGFTASLLGKSPDEVASFAASVQMKALNSQLCRIYVGSLDYSLTDQDIRQVFSAFGTIVNIDMPKEGTRSKGFCFIEYSTPESAEMALSTMPGFNLKGRAIKVGRPTALGGQAATTVPSLGIAKAGGVNAAEAGQIAAAMLLAKTESGALPNNDILNRVYVGCVPPTFTADDIKQIFDVFGKILSCQLIPNAERPGTHRGYGFIEYSTPEEAKLAIETMNDFPVAGKVLKVNYVTTAARSLPPPTGTAAVLVNVGPPGNALGSATGANAVPIPMLPFGLATTTTATTSNSEIIEATRSTSVTGTASIDINTTVPTPSAVVVSSPVLLLSDMVDACEANDELKDEIKQECSKYGTVREIQLAVNEAINAVRIFVLFEVPEEAASAVPKLHDRWFGGRRIQARLYDLAAYQSFHYWL